VGSTLLSSMSIGRETLMSHGSAMAAMSDNISNSNTTGFKANSPTFEDFLGRGEGTIGDIPKAQAGDGSKMNIEYIFTQGGVEPTGRPYDFAIEGDGLFALAKPSADGTPSEEIFFSRAGNFSLDNEGRLVNPMGYFLMGYQGVATDTLVPVQTDGLAVAAVPTTEGSISGNLNAETAPIVGALPDEFASVTELTSYSPFSTAIRIVDSLGTAHEATVNFFKTGANTWSARAYVDGGEVAGGTVGTPAAIGPATQVVFGPDGRPTVDPLTLNVQAAWANGANASAAVIDISGFRGYSSPSTVYGTAQNGIIPGTVQGIAIDERGVISQQLSNGEKNQIGTLALAKFPSVDGLQRVGNSLFTATNESGAVTYAAPADEGRGTISQGSLENSNVDLADQFVNVIKIQRTYQAGSQVIKTADQLLESTIQIA